MPLVIDGKAVAADLRARVRVQADALATRIGRPPGLAVVLVGADPASQVYVGAKGRAAVEAGFRSFEHRLPADTAIGDLVGLIQQLNRDPAVDGILVQLPLPSGLDPAPVLAALDPTKDVDGLTRANIGALWAGEAGLVPCTPAGVMRLLATVHPRLDGLDAVVLGRSALVGKPVAALLLAANATVTLAHSRTQDLAGLCRRADILIAAIGRPQLVLGDWVKPGATVIDVGINRVATADGKSRLVGDVDYAAAAERAGAITPVPGGVGPMTIACLLANTLTAACRREGLAEPVP